MNDRASYYQTQYEQAQRELTLLRERIERLERSLGIANEALIVKESLNEALRQNIQDLQEELSKAREAIGEVKI